MSQEQEPSIHDYARFHDLVQDYRYNKPLEFLPHIDEHLYQAALEDFSDTCKHRSGLCLNSVPEKTSVGDVKNASQITLHDERMFVDADSASVLASISQSARASPHFSYDLRLVNERSQWLKCELPLLRSDHDCDLEEFSRPFAPDLKSEFLPSETLDEEADEGLSWPSKYLDLPKELWKKVLAEKPRISAESLRYISETVSRVARNNHEPSLEMLDKGFTSKKRNLPEQSTPQLLPMSPENLPFIPSSTVGELHLLSDKPSPEKDELCRMELQVFAKDAFKLMTKAAESSPQSSDPMLLDSNSLGDLYSPLKGLRDTPSSPPDDRLPPRDLKVEVPLSEMGSDGGPPWKRKSVSFNESLTKIIPDLPALIPGPEGDKVLDTCFNKTINPIAAEVERRIEQEQLQEADVVSRIAVPAMDFTLPIAPWKVSVRGPGSDRAHARPDPFVSEMKLLQLKQNVWPLNSKAEQGLQWTPFPTALGKVKIQETMNDDGSLTIFCAQPPCPDAHQLTERHRGLCMFDDNTESNGDELDEGSFQEEQGFNFLVRKRRMDLEANEEQISASTSRATKSTRLLGSMIGNMVSIPVSLEKFLQTRAVDVQVKAKSMVDCATDTAARPTQLIKSQHKLQDHMSDIRRVFPSVSSSSNFKVPQDRRTFIVSATLLKDRKLVREIQKRFTGAELVVRESFIPTCSKTNTSLTTFDPSNALLNMFEREADIILSPSTGLLRTTLQKIKQRSLPGQADQSVIRERIKYVAPRYERLIIIIDEDRWPSENDLNILGDGLDSSDSEAIAHLIAFCSGLEDSTQVLFSSGGVEALSKWIVALMIKYSAENAGIKVSQDECPWEIFLRRAGMNAYAAQAILRKLDWENMDRSATTDFGLTAFIKMSAGERLARFEGLLGGRKLLLRVNQILEARW